MIQVRFRLEVFFGMTQQLDSFTTVTPRKGISLKQFFPSVKPGDPPLRNSGFEGFYDIFNGSIP